MPKCHFSAIGPGNWRNRYRVPPYAGFAGRDVLHVAGAPIGGVEAGLYQAPEGRERPVSCAGDITVLHGIEVKWT
jgi:hypothetical protein